MPIPQSVQDLVARFDYNRDAYRSPQYNETQLRREFLDPFFAALGWDVNNEQGFAEAYKDVVHEDAIKIGGATKAPDYSFRIGGTRKFFVEAKKPAVNLKDDPKPAFQLRRYAWSAKLPLSILSDFEEFAAYDCRMQPDEKDTPGMARTLYIPYTDYAARWEEIEAVFSRNAILKGAFDKYAVDNKSRRGTAEVDAAFLKEIEAWRESLAMNIALRNPDLRNRELNFAVQIIIDRIIFLRICEDRGIDVYGKLQALLNGKDIYARLLQLFREADDRYNSGLFHFRMEKGRDDVGLDTLTPRLNIDDKTLKEILTTLYYPCPYEFSVLPADILGQVYEQFLGKVIRLDAKHRAVVEDKPEVKKAGGVYYTPTYIVDYIVEQTVGKLLDGKTPKQAEKLRILDPACGSGSFLIGAYQRLLDWHQQWYEKDGTAKHAKGKDAKLYQGAGGAWRLTTSERRRILLANIYGVDIDTQAVEVTKLSLLLKMLEGETQQTVNATLSMFHERVLPDLDANIQCGNSLIGPDFYDNKQLTLLDEEEMYRVNVFDWKKAFPVIYSNKNGGGSDQFDEGFDVIIGNPPYGAHLDEDVKQFLSMKYPIASDFETSQYFIIKAASLCKGDGLLSFIVPNTLFLNLYAKKFRNFITSRFAVEKIVNMSSLNVFNKPSVRTVIPLLVNNKLKASHVAFEFSNIPKVYQPLRIVEQSELLNDDANWVAALSNAEVKPFISQIGVETVPLSDILSVSQGLIPYDKYRGHDEQTIKNRIWNADYKKDDTYKRELKGADVTRYALNWNGKQWISYGTWLAAPRKPEFFRSPRLLFREITDAKTGLLYVAHSDEEYYNNPGIINAIPRGLQYSILYVLGIVNSRLIAYYHYKTSPKANKGLFPKILVDDVRKLPIRGIDFGNPMEKAHHDRMVHLVEQMLTLNKQLIGCAPTTRTVLERQIEITDKQIDALVYELYGLTPEEIALVERG